MKILLMLFVFLSLSAQDYKEVNKLLASAGIYDNLTSKSNSIKVVTKTLLDQAESKVGSENKIKFTAQPNVFLKEYANKEYCLGKLAETQKKPIVFYQSFPDLNGFSEYFSKLATGKNDDGDTMYEECPKDCSFNFTIDLKKDTNRYKSEIKAICGEARDKDDNQYLLAVAVK